MRHCNNKARKTPTGLSPDMQETEKDPSEIKPRWARPKRDGRPTKDDKCVRLTQIEAWSDHVEESCPQQSGYQRRQTPRPPTKTGAGSHDGPNTLKKATATLTKPSSEMQIPPTRAVSAYWNPGSGKFFCIWGEWPAPSRVSAMPPDLRSSTKHTSNRAVHQHRNWLRKLNPRPYRDSTGQHRYKTNIYRTKERVKRRGHCLKD